MYQICKICHLLRSLFYRKAFQSFFYYSSIYIFSLLGGGGCSDGGKFKKPSEPWEAADGCLYLLCELTNIVAMAQSLSDLLPSIEEAARHRHYTMH